MPVALAMSTLNWLDSYGSLSSSLVCSKEGFLQHGVELDERVKHFIFAAQQKLILRQTGQRLARSAKMRHRARCPHKGRGDHFQDLAVGLKRGPRRVSPKVTSESAAMAT